MGMAQAMGNLVGEIRSATAARSVFLTNLGQDVEKHRQESKKRMNNIHNENRSKARELRGKLTSLRRELASEERSRQNTAHQETERRRVVVSESRSQTHSLLNRAQLERKDAARALKQKISSEINNIHRAVNDIRGDAKSMLGEIAADLRGAHQAWAGVKKK